MNITVFYSSITGNTRKLAAYVAKSLEKDGYTVELEESSLPEDRDQTESILPDISILAFWCRRSGLDDISAGMLDSWKGRKIIGIGTIGGNAGGDYGDRVRSNVKEAIEKDNICLGVGICQGAVNLERIEKRRHLPRESKHYVSDEKLTSTKIRGK